MDTQKLSEILGSQSQKLIDTNEELETTEQQCAQADSELKALQQRFDDIQKIDTNVWLGLVNKGSASPRFVPRHERKTRFVAFLNLKGGVGKTTLVANLAAAYATGITGAAQRVLVIDLDYQGTLSNMCVRTDFLLDRRATRKTSDALLADENEQTSDAILTSLMAPFEGTDGLAKVIVLRFPDSKPTRWVSFSGGERRALDEKGLLNLLVRVTELRPK